MTGRDLFGALVRVLGLCLLLFGVTATIASFNGSSFTLLLACWQIIAGLILLFGARGLVQAIYGDKTGDG